MATTKTIKLNVGGKRFETLESTLAGSSYFKGLLERFVSDEGKRQEIFVDRKPELFDFVLEALRGNEPTVWNAEIEQEFAFFGLNVVDASVENATLSEAPNVEPWTFPEEWHVKKPYYLTEHQVVTERKLLTLTFDLGPDLTGSAYLDHFKKTYVIVYGSCKAVDLYMDVWSNEWNRLLTHEEVMEHGVLRDLKFKASHTLDTAVEDEITYNTLELYDAFKIKTFENPFMSDHKKVSGFKAALNFVESTKHECLNLIREGHYDQPYGPSIEIEYHKHLKWTVKNVHPVGHISIVPLLKNWPLVAVDRCYTAYVFVHLELPWEEAAFDEANKRWTFGLDALTAPIKTNEIYFWFEDENGNKIRFDTAGFLFNDRQHKTMTEREVLDQMKRHISCPSKPIYSLLSPHEFIDFHYIDKIGFFATFPKTETRIPKRLVTVLKVRHDLQYNQFDYVNAQNQNEDQ